MEDFGEEWEVLVGVLEAALAEEDRLAALVGLVGVALGVVVPVAVGKKKANNVGLSLSFFIAKTKCFQ